MTTLGRARKRKAARQWIIVAATVAATLAIQSRPALAFLARPVIFAALGNTTAPPRGWLQFCAEKPSECRPTGEQPRDVTLTPELLEQLFSINRYANDRVVWTPDSELYGKDEHWAYPLDRGDCEDIVLLKRQLLSKAGWPTGALLITTAEDRDANRGLHAVLTVRTDRGELILDNRTPEILFWYETNYHFLKRQSPNDPNVWIAFSDKQPRPVRETAAP